MEFSKGTAYANEREAAFYDGNALTTAANVERYQDSPYHALHLETMAKIKEHDSKNIFEIGCGHGVFSEMLHDDGDYGYLGFDFSEKRLEIARRRVPAYTYLCQDIYKTRLFDEASYDTAVCHEVLEHLENDFYVFEKLKKNTYFVFSVPEYDAYAHVRYFSSVDAVVNRYKTRLDIHEVRVTDRIFLVDGTVL